MVPIRAMSTVTATMSEICLPVPPNIESPTLCSIVPIGAASSPAAAYPVTGAAIGVQCR